MSTALLIGIMLVVISLANAANRLLLLCISSIFSLSSIASATKVKVKSEVEVDTGVEVKTRVAVDV